MGDKEQIVNVTETSTPSTPTDTNKQPEIQQHAAWPTDPTPLAADKTSQFWMNVYDGLLCFIPVVLIAKVILVVVISQKDKAHHGIDIEFVSKATTFLVEFNGQLSTAFTIIFITIMTTLVRRLALFKAQQGAYLTELEQLQASISLPSTVKMVFLLRNWTYTSLWLVALWSFYYLGSQACQLEYVYRDSLNPTYIRTAWLDPNLPSQLIDAYDPEAMLTSLRQTLVASTYYMTDNPTYQTAFDLFGNFLTPNMEYITRFTDDEPTRWISLKSIGNSDHILFANYLGPQIYTWKPRNQIYTWDNSTTLIITDNYQEQISINMSNNDRGLVDGVPTLPQQIDVWIRWNDTYMTLPLGASRFQCNITEHHIDLAVHCAATGCVARKIRYTKPYTSSVVTTRFDDHDYAQSFFSDLLLSTGPILPNSILSSEVVWDNVLYQAMGNAENLSSSDLAAIAAESNPPGADVAMGSYLTPIVNTFYTASQNEGYSCGDENDTKLSEHCVEIMRKKGAVYDPQYVLYPAWIALDFISCFILIFAAVWAFKLRRRTIAPDIFGYVSTLTRDNPHMPALPDNGTTLNGLERTRLLGKVRIKIGDVGSATAVGATTGAPADDPETAVGKVGVVLDSASANVDPLDVRKRYL